MMEFLALIGACAIAYVAYKIVKAHQITRALNDSKNYFKLAHLEIIKRVRRDDAINEDMLCHLILTPLGTLYDEEKTELRSNDLIRFEYYCFVIHCINASLSFRKTQNYMDKWVYFSRAIKQCTDIFVHIFVGYNVRDIITSRIKEYNECVKRKESTLPLLNTNVLFAVTTKKLRTDEDSVDVLSFSLEHSMLVMAHTHSFFIEMIPAYCESVEKFLRLKFTEQ